MKKVSILENWWKRHGQTILMIIIVLLASIVSFKFGQIDAHNNTKIDVSINDTHNINPAQEEANMAIEALKRQGIDIRKEVTQRKNKEKDCLFVASRNSKKYHTKDCKYGKKIKAANLVCFKSIEEAKDKGYEPAGGCFKK
jgi:uncharacterized membrane protein YhiD involved in acid resistance